MSVHPGMPKHPQNPLMYLGEEITQEGESLLLPTQPEVLQIGSLSPVYGELLPCCPLWIAGKCKAESQRAGQPALFLVTSRSKGEKAARRDFQPYLRDVSSMGIFPSL